MNAHTFRPKLWAVLLTLLLAGGMVKAGCWQYSRGLQKQAMRAERLHLADARPRPLLDDIRPPMRGELRQVSVEGSYRPELGVLLDNQPRRDLPGVHAWTPLQLDDGRLVVVDRGWLPLSEVQWKPAANPPEGRQQIEGTWRTLPKAAMQLGQTPSGCPTPRPTLVSYPDLTLVRCLFGETTLDGLLELSSTMPGGFERDWVAAGANEIPPARHFAYAAQWWLFAITLLALFIKINLKKKSAAND